MASTTIIRRDFVARFMRDTGVSYAQACRIYESMCRIFEDGIVNARKIALGNVGALTPVWRPPKDVHKHFDRKPGGKIVRTHKVYSIDGRYAYRFKLYRAFEKSRAMKGA